MLTINFYVVVFYSHLVVLQVSLVAKGHPRDFTFTAEDNIDEAARITLPSYLFQTQGNCVNM